MNLTDGISRSGDILILKGGDVRLRYQGAFTIHGCISGEKFTAFVLDGSTFETSKSKVVTPDTALIFIILEGGPALGRPNSSMVIVYKGRVYARATNLDVKGRARTGGYKRVAKVDGVKRLTIAGLLSIADDGALHDIIQDQFVLV